MDFSALIVGLGNPGKEYEATRHNFGFMALEAFLRRLEGDGPVKQLSAQKDPYLLWRADSRRFGSLLLLEPLSYMNRSGEPVQKVAAYYRVTPERIVVLHDELDLPAGRMKMKKGGGNAGHNGLKSIQQMLGTPDFIRLRLGIGKPAGFDTASYVLGRFTADERAAVEKLVPAACDGLEELLHKGLNAAVTFCNSYQG